MQWLEVFLIRFFERSQFKRSAMPNGPSDDHADAWLEDLRDNVP